MATEKETISFRASNQLISEVEAYADEHNIILSDAFRELVRTGLESENMDDRFNSLYEHLDEIEAQAAKCENSECILRSIFD